MTPREAINFVKTPLGAFLGFLLLLVIAFLIFTGIKGREQDDISKRPTRNASGDSQQVIETIERDLSPLSFPGEAPAASPVGPAPSKKGEGVKTLPPITLFADNPETGRPTVDGIYAPYGRLIRCELVITVDSSVMATPIIGLVTDDVFHDGHLVIPAGTEVHGRARVDRVRERIASDNQWTLVWQTGEELSLQGIALDREDEPETGGWSITDGSAGLRGKLIKSDDLGEFKLFAATFLSGAAGALTEREQTLFGSQTTSSLRNAPLRGTQEVLNSYAQQIYDTIQREGYYVRVPAGKQFYLYVTEPIEASQAMIGSTKAAERKADTPSSSPCPER